MCSILQGEFNICAQIKKQAYNRLRFCRFGTFGIHLEIFKIPIEVEYQKLFLIFTFAKQVFAQTCTSTYHLPKFYLRVNRFEENQVHDFRHINARIKHIDRYGDLR